MVIAVCAGVTALPGIRSNAASSLLHRPIGVQPAAQHKKQSGPPKAAGWDVPPLPTDRDRSAEILTRTLVLQLLKGKVNPALLTPGMRAKLTPGKVKSLNESLSGYGPLKSARCVSRTAGESADTDVVRVILGETAFIATLQVTRENKIDDLRVLEQ